jgi:archaellum component FlaC
MSAAMEEAEEALRELSWEFRILHAQVLEIAEHIPATGHARVRQIIDRMQTASNTFRETIRGDEVESNAQTLARLHEGIAKLRRELNTVILDLREVAGLPPRDRPPAEN